MGDKYKLLIPEACLKTCGFTVTREVANGRAYQLAEMGAVALRQRANEAEPADHIRSVIRWLKVDQSSRYRPDACTTFCNVYASDVADLCSVYLPRVWWKPSALARLRIGDNVAPEYGVTVTEMSANSLATWLTEYGSYFGWKPASGMTELQERANAGELCLITARATDLVGHGHVSVVVSEHASKTALRERERVLCPVQSQAGRTPTLIKRATPWWEGSEFRSAELWSASLPKYYSRCHKHRLSAPEKSGQRIWTIAAFFVRRAFPELTTSIQEMMEAETILYSKAGAALLTEALIAAEDRRFLYHPGFDVYGIARALWSIAWHRRLEGASTLEQQLVRTVTGRRDPTVSRKLLEIALSLWVSQNFRKSHIATCYLRTAYFGWKMNGLSQAAKRLEISLPVLTVREACDLVAALRYPLPREPGGGCLRRWRRRSEYIEGVLRSGCKNHGRAA